ncbi:MAG TPA: hypothetical protein VK422_21830, partial [Pyrinomonadaceae bacterium]|nr:hypothetical protein [Pyrinomonadaceae bacterium]
MKHHLAPRPRLGRTPLVISLLCAALLCGALAPAAALAGGRQRGARQKVARKPAARTKSRRPPVPPPPARAQAPGESEVEDDAGGRSEWFMYKRAFPFDSIPAGARREAWEAARRAPKVRDRSVLMADRAAERQV